MKASASIELVWRLAGAEAIASDYGEIQPEHFLMALLKFAEFPEEEIPDAKEGSDLGRALREEIRVLRQSLAAASIDSTRLRRALRTQLGNGGQPHQRGTVHRSSASRRLVDDAVELAGTEALASPHLLRAVLRTPTPTLAGIMTELFPAALDTVADEAHAQAPTVAATTPIATAALLAEDWPDGKVLLQKYVVERVLGEGGLGKVYLVRERTSEHRFAVKRTKRLDPESRRRFHSELQIWIDLPAYPHLVACRFFRTLGEEIAIFAEYIEGGSLQRWIEEKKLASVPQILDVAIQSAWGLHLLHEMGLVHRDVKPGNVLITSDGLVKITDFGYGVHTPRYCSPEQANGAAVGRASDVWSWAAVVLEMFLGEAVWEYGSAAHLALEEHCGATVQRDAETLGVPMPRQVSTILRKCFRKLPEERSQDLSAVAESLKRVYREITGRDYARSIPPLPHDLADIKLRLMENEDHESRFSPGYQWLCLAYEASGQEAPPRSERRMPPGTSRKVRAISELALYDEAQGLLEKAARGRRDDLERRLADFYLEKARLHSHAEDFPAATRCREEAIKLMRKALMQQNTRSNAKRLAQALADQASLHSQVGELPATEFLAKEAIGIYESLLGDKEEAALEQKLAGVCHTRANAAFEQADYPAALDYYDREIELYQKLTAALGEEPTSPMLAEVYMSKANTIWAAGHPQGALKWHDRAIAIWDRLVKAGREEYARSLAKGCYNKGISLRSAEDHSSALTWLDRSRKHYERLVHEGKRGEIANELANVYTARANSMVDTQQAPESLAWYEKALEIYNTLVNQNGRQEFAGDLARVRALYATALLQLNERDQGMMEAERALPVLEQEAKRTHRSDLRVTLQQLRRVTGK